MKLLAALLFSIAALVNLAPVSGVLSGARLEALYQMPFEGSDLLVLMRHRALLFGIVGTLLLAAAFHPPLRSVATACGLFSMVSYIAIVLLESPTNTALLRIAWIDVGATVALCAGWATDRFWLA